MTPLATYLMKQILLLPRKREHIWIEPQNATLLRQALVDCHFFEVTKCLPLLPEIASVMKARPMEESDAMYGTYSFLPAPKTWIEWRHGSGNRIAVLLEESNRIAKATMFCELLAANLGQISLTSGDYYDYGGQRHFPNWLKAGPEAIVSQDTASALLAIAHTLLLLINTPKIIGRRQHMPNRGLERRLTRGLGPGKFPLHAWTEIELRVAKPIDIDDGEPHEAHLTGRRALHFCRKHIRIRLGKLEYVSAHWRGDPAIGIKRSRYSVVP